MTRSYEKNERTGRLNQVLTCCLCSRKFTKLSNGQDHIRMHLQQKPHSCPKCGKKFTQSGNCDRHILNRICKRREQRRDAKLANARLLKK